mgnify:CR=1 FL=1
MTTSASPEYVDRWVVLGDSISDGMWTRDPAGVGSAWPGSALRLARSRGRPLSFLNRSRGGARSIDVLRALEPDPSIVCDHGVVVFAGANDLWRRWVPWEGQDPLDPDDYARTLRLILELCRDSGATALAVMTPCLLDADPDHPWNQALAEYREEAGRVARATGAVLVPSGEELLEAVRAFPTVKWTYDGVHPRPVGHERIALTWLHHVLGAPVWPTLALPDKPDGFRLSSWP